MEAVWMNFSGEKTTITEDVLSGRMIGRAWNVVGRWLGDAKAEEEGGESEGASEEA